MKFKVGDPVEFYPTITSIFPQDDGSLLLGLKLFAGAGPVSLHDRWVTRAAGVEGPLAEGEQVTVTGKVTSMHTSGGSQFVSFRLDGSAVITTVAASHIPGP